jgi:hypothetical protein
MTGLESEPETLDEYHFNTIWDLLRNNAKKYKHFWMCCQAKWFDEIFEEITKRVNTRTEPTDVTRAKLLEKAVHLLCEYEKVEEDFDYMGGETFRLNRENAYWHVTKTRREECVYDFANLIATHIVYRPDPMRVVIATHILFNRDGSFNRVEIAEFEEEVWIRHCQCLNYIEVEALTEKHKIIYDLLTRYNIEYDHQREEYEKMLKIISEE